MTERDLATLRRDLVKARDELRRAEYGLKTEKAAAEYRVTEAHWGEYSALKNDTERGRFLTFWLSQDGAYIAPLRREWLARYTVDEIEAEIEIFDDARRERMGAQRDREIDLKAAEIEQQTRLLDMKDRELSHHLESVKDAQETISMLREMGGVAVSVDDAPPVRRKAGRA